MHSKGMVLFPRVTKAMRRRQIVRLIELCFWMVVISIFCVLTALAMSGFLKLLGVD